MAFEHAIPYGGTIKIILPKDIKVINPTLMKSNCYRLDKTTLP